MNQMLGQWSRSLFLKFEKHGRHLKAGLYGTPLIELDGNVVEDPNVLSRILQHTVIANKTLVELLLASIPQETLLHLMEEPLNLGNATLRDHILDLLGSCAPSMISIDFALCTRRLLICLHVLNDIVKVPLLWGRSPVSEVLCALLKDFVNISRMQPLFGDEDPSIRTLASSIFALDARHAIHKLPPDLYNLDWIQNVMGQSIDTIVEHLDNLVMLDSICRIPGVAIE